MLLNVSYKDSLSMMFAGGSKQQYENIRRDELLTVVKIIWLHFKALRLSRDDSSAHMQRQKKKK